MHLPFCSERLLVAYCAFFHKLKGRRRNSNFPEYCHINRRNLEAGVTFKGVSLVWPVFNGSYQLQTGGIAMHHFAPLNFLINSDSCFSSKKDSVVFYYHFRAKAHWKTESSSNCFQFLLQSENTCRKTNCCKSYYVSFTLVPFNTVRATVRFHAQKPSFAVI